MSGREDKDRRRLAGTKTGVPQWVRDLVERQERTIRELQTRVEVLEAERAGDGGSAFEIREYGGMGNHPLDSQARVIEWHDEGGDFTLQLSTETDAGGPGGLQVMCTSWQGITLTPGAANVVYIKPGRLK